jgi:hypothetical protein
VRVKTGWRARWCALPIFVALLILASLWAPTRRRAMAATASGYHSLAKVTLGGEGFWDYLAMDAVARRLYISRWTHVMVVDADSYQVVGDIPGIEGVHGIAIAREFGRGFISEDEAYRVTIFDLKTLKKIGSATTGQNPSSPSVDTTEPPPPSTLPREVSLAPSILAVALSTLPQTAKDTSTTTSRTRTKWSRSIRRRSRS